MRKRGIRQPRGASPPLLLRHHRNHIQHTHHLRWVRRRPHRMRLHLRPQVIQNLHPGIRLPHAHQQLANLHRGFIVPAQHQKRLPRLNRQHQRLHHLIHQGIHPSAVHRPPQTGTRQRRRRHMRIHHNRHVRKLTTQRRTNPMKHGIPTGQHRYLFPRQFPKNPVQRRQHRRRPRPPLRRNIIRQQIQLPP